MAGDTFTDGDQAFTARVDGIPGVPTVRILQATARELSAVSTGVCFVTDSGEWHSGSFVSWRKNRDKALVDAIEKLLSVKESFTEHVNTRVAQLRHELNQSITQEVA